MDMENGRILFSCENLTVKSRSGTYLNGLNFEIKSGESWAILGQNGAGKSYFAKILGNKKIDFTGNLQRFANSQIVSFEEINEIIEADRQDDAYISEENILNPGSKAADLLPPNSEKYLKKFNLSHTLNVSIRHLSTGELAKILIIRAISESPKILVLDEPFDGLDAKSRRELSQIIENLIESGVCVVIFLNRTEEIPQNITHLAFMGNEHSILLSGEKKTVENSKEFKHLIHFHNNKIKEIPSKITVGAQRDVPVLLAELKNISIKYGEKTVLDNVSWTIKKKEHYKITGPNGCGKSTLLSLISGDNPQSFVNDITLFGQKRGTGESIWDIKKNIGIVSTLFHRDYRVNISALNTVISGFHDTTGIYRKPTILEIETANQWLNLAGLKSIAKKPFASLSYGEQRLILILRAMVKHPLILILDEPCFGLDVFNRELVLNLVEIIASSPDTTILFVSHHEEDFVKSIKNHLEFVKSDKSKSGYLLRFTPKPK